MSHRSDGTDRTVSNTFMPGYSLDVRPCCFRVDPLADARNKPVVVSILATRDCDGASVTDSVVASGLSIVE